MMESDTAETTEVGPELETKQVSANVTCYNPHPTHLVIEDVITKDIADELITLVDNDGRECSNPFERNCVEYCIEPYSLDAPSQPLPVDERIRIGLTYIVNGLRPAIERMFRNNACHIITGYSAFRVLRWDEEGGTEPHYNWKCFSDEEDGRVSPGLGRDCFTLAISLNDHYSGGNLILDNNIKVECPMLSGVVWDGWTWHAVEPVEGGQRYCVYVHYVGVLKV